MRCIMWLIHPLGNVIPLVFHTFRPESVKYNLLKYVFICIRINEVVVIQVKVQISGCQNVVF